MPEDSDVLLMSLVGESVIREMMDVLSTVGDGCVVEVGVYKGGTAYFLDQWAQHMGRQTYLYDTFTGIPYAGPDDSHRIGDFGDTSRETVAALIPKACVVEGVFPSSAVPMPPIAFAHIDVDQYQSYVDSCKYLDPLMAHKGVMWFDDANCLPSAARAVHEMYDGRIQKSQIGKWYVRF